MIRRSVPRYTVLYRDREEGLAAGECVTIQTLYRDRLRLDRLRAWLLGSVSRYKLCIVTGEGLTGWVVVSRYSLCIVTSGQFGWACHDIINCIMTGE